MLTFTFEPSHEWWRLGAGWLPEFQSGYVQFGPVVLGVERTGQLGIASAVAEWLGMRVPA